MLKKFFTEEKGQSATEYILIVSVIVGVVLVVGRVFKDQLQQIVGNVMGQVQKSAQSFMGSGGQ